VPPLPFPLPLPFPFPGDGWLDPGRAVILHVNDWEAERPEVFVAFAVTLYVPTVVGVPEMRPVLDAIERPGGSPLAAYCSVRPPGSVALSCNVRLCPTTFVKLPGLSKDGPVGVVELDGWFRMVQTND